MNAIKFNPDGSSEAIELTDSEVRGVVTRIKRKQIDRDTKEYKVGDYNVVVYLDKIFIRGFSDKENAIITHNTEKFFTQNEKFVIFREIKKSPASLGDFYCYGFLKDEKSVKSVIDHFRLRLLLIHLSKRSYGKTILLQGGGNL